MCRETTSGSNKAASPPLRTPCAPVPRSHCTLASKCKHSRFAVDEPCCPRVVCFAFEIALLKLCSLFCLHTPYPQKYKVSFGVPDYCAFDQTNAFYLFVCLLLVYSFSPRVHSIPRGPHILKKRIRTMCCFCCMGQFTGENPKTCFRRSAVACKRLRYASCLTLQTLSVALLFIFD